MNCAAILCVTRMSGVYVLFLLFWSTQAAPIPYKMVDMTYIYDETTIYWPTLKNFEMKVTTNGTEVFGFWLQAEEISSATHLGTHMDAPCHFGLGMWRIEDIPIERFTAPAAVVDITDKAEANADAMVDISDLQDWEINSETSLNETIVVIKSGWGRRWNNRTAFIGTTGNDITKLHYPGMSPEAARWLVDNRNIYGVLSETLSLDNGQSKDYMAHRTLFSGNIYGLENVANVEKLPNVGALIRVMPMKIGKACGAPTRIFAEIPKVIWNHKDNACFNRRHSNQASCKYLAEKTIEL